MKVGFAFDAKSDYILNNTEPKDKYAEFDSEATISEIEHSLTSGGYTVQRIGNAKKLIEKILTGEKYDIIFNICEGIKGRNRESQVPAILELFNLPYTGSDALTISITLDKILSKKLIQYHKIKTPEFISIPKIEKFDANLAQISKLLPAIAKPSQEGTSKGISEKSLCYSIAQLKKQTKLLLETYDQPVLIEKFIKGYEFTVLVTGNDPPHVLPPVQTFIKGRSDLGYDFYTQARVESTDITYVCSKNIDQKLKKRLYKLVLNSFIALECRDVARIDVRVDYDMQPYFLECNPLPNMGKIDVFPIIAKEMGLTYEKLVCSILEIGLKRYKLVSMGTETKII